MNDYELPKIPVFKLLTPVRVAALLRSPNAILREAPQLVQWGKEHHLLSNNTKKRRTRRMGNYEHEHIPQSASQSAAG